MRKIRKEMVAKTTAVEALVPQHSPVELAATELVEKIKEYIQASDADNTVKARENDWLVFDSWCQAHDLKAMPASVETVAKFIADHIEARATATLHRYVQTIGDAHRAAEYQPLPTEHVIIKKLMKGIRRKKGVRQVQKDPIINDMLRAALRVLDSHKNSVIAVRDRAVFLAGLAGAFRRSELCSLKIENLTWTDNGIVTDILKSKTNQEGEPEYVALPKIKDEFICPYTALKKWFEVSGVKSGPVFRGVRKNGNVRETPLSDGVVGEIVKRAVKGAGLDEKLYGAHSLRAGYVTSARIAGVDWATIMAQTRHKQLSTVKRYARYTPDIFDETKIVEVFSKAFENKGDK